MHSPLQSGFTLIELLSVIAIVGILSVGVMIFINPMEQLNKSRDAKRKSDLAEIQKALEIYYQDNGSYPLSSTDGKIMGSTGAVAWGSSGFDPYMKTMPKDPGSSQFFYYSSSGQSYFLFASLDRKNKDLNACNTAQDGPCLQAQNVGANCGTGKYCNYGVSSPNVSPNSN